MNTSHRMLFCLFTCFIVKANAATFTDVSQYISTHLVSQGSVGLVWGYGNDTQTLNLGSGIVKTYTANHPTNVMPEGELFAGVNAALPYQLQGQVGLAVAAAGYTNLDGDIWDDASPEFNNYTYQYKLCHTHIALKGVILLDRNYPVIPWFGVSAGVGFNSAYGYSNTPTTPEAVMTPGFTSHLTTAFTYTLGLGLQRQINSHWQIGAGYQFADWGRSELGTASGQNSSNTLSLSHYYTSGVLANLTFIA